jgi:hypothetical protein
MLAWSYIYWVGASFIKGKWGSPNQADSCYQQSSNIQAWRWHINS